VPCCWAGKPWSGRSWWTSLPAICWGILGATEREQATKEAARSRRAMNGKGPGMRIVILSRQPSLYSTRVLVEAGQARGHDVGVLDTLQFDIRVSRRKAELFYQGEPVGAVDAVIPRIGASITSFGLAVVRQFEMMGVYCLN